MNALNKTAKDYKLFLLDRKTGNTEETDCILRLNDDEVIDRQVKYSSVKYAAQLKEVVGI